MIGINVRMEKCKCKRGISGDKPLNPRLNEEEQEKVGE
jgi:hypothetical protein